MSDTIKLFGRTIALPLPSEGGGQDDSKKGSPTKERITEAIDKDTETESVNGDALTSTAHEHDQENRPEKPLKDSNAEEQQSDSGEKPLKKPDKILPCPRCRSMETKFCYYNNYNVNQPRHFCKNCQRYWTAGGTMRSMPVGAGRRKNRNLIHYSTLKTNGTVTSVLNLAENMMNCNQMEENSTGSSTDEGSVANLQGFAPQFVWPYPWIPPFYPSAAYLGFSDLNIPWILLGSGPHSPTLGKHSRDGNVISKSDNSSSNKQGNLWISKTLRIDDPEEAAKNSIWATMGFKNDKTHQGGLFRDFNNHKVNHGGPFKEFNNHKVEAKSQILLANPSAFSRSISFQESS